MRPQLLTAPEDWPTSNCIQRWFPSIFVTLRETRKLTYQHVKGDNFMLWQCLKKKILKSILTWEWFAPLVLSEMDCKTWLQYHTWREHLAQSSHLTCIRIFLSWKKLCFKRVLKFFMKSLRLFFSCTWCGGGGGGHLKRVSNVGLQNIYIYQRNRWKPF